MARKIAEVSVVADLDTRKYNAELKALTAKTIAELDAIGREKVKVNIDIEKNDLDREIVRVKKQLNELSKIKKGEDGYQQAKANAKQFERYLKDLQIQMLENRQAAKELGLAFKILGISEKEHADQVKRLQSAVVGKTQVLRDSTDAHGDHAEAVLSDSRAMRSYQMALRGAEFAMAKLGDEQTKFNRVWSFFTNSKTPIDTLKKLGREGVRLGPFNATIKGLISAFTFLGPIVQSTALSLLSFIGVAAGAAAGLGAFAVGALGGLGQGFLGIRMAMTPVINDFKVLKQTGDAYNKAVMKYGEGSKQAKKAQEQMNTAMKSASPLARQAAQSLQEAQLVFAKLTSPTRNSISLILTDAMRTMKQMAPSFAENTNAFSGGLQRGVSGFMSQMRADSSQRNGGAFGTMFRNAASAIQPLVAGIGNITMALARIGASASRHLTPLVETFQSWSERVLSATGNTTSLNRRVDSLMGDLKSVGRLFLEAGRWARSFFGTSREAGRSLTDSLTATFRQWNASISDGSGREELSKWFMNAADLVRNLVNTFRPLASATATWAEALTPVTSTLFSVTTQIAKLVGWMAKLPVISQFFQIFAAGAGLIFAVNIAATMLFGTFTRTAGVMAMGAVKLMTWVNTSMLVTSALTTLEAVAPRVAAALLALGTSASLALGVFGLLAAAAAALVYGISRIDWSGGMDRLRKQAEDLDKALEKSKQRAVDLKTAMSSAFDRKYMAAANLEGAKDRLAQTTPGTKEHEQAVRDVRTAYRDLGIATKEAAKSVKDLNDEYGQKGQLGNALEKIRNISDQLRTGFSLDSMPYLKGGPLEKLAKDLDNITGNENPKRLRELAAAAREVANDTSNSKTTRNEFGEQARLIDQLVAQYDRLKVAKQNQAAVPILAARADAGMGIDDTSMQNALGKLANKNYKLAVGIALNIQDQGQVARVAETARQALEAGINAKKIQAIIDANPDNAKKIIEQILNTKIPGKSFSIRAYTNAIDVISGILGDLSQLAGRVFSFGIKGNKVNAEGGVINAASGYKVGTAGLNAGRRPMRNGKLGGRISEPTLLVGEENRTEYVIATNPAYRAQNKRYLAAAASDLGMAVVESAASGRAHNYRRAIFNTSEIEGNIKSGKNRAKSLSKQIKGIRDNGVTKSERAKLGRAEAELRTLRYRLRSGDLSKGTLGLSRRLQTWEAQADAFSSRMDLADAQGNSKSFEQARKGRDGVLRKLLSAYRRALPGASPLAKAKLSKAIDDYQREILSNRAKSMGDASGLQAAEISKQNALITDLRNQAAIGQAYGLAAGSMFGGSFGGVVASGGSRMSRKGAAGSGESPTIVINTLHPGDPDTLMAIGQAATSGFDLQGGVTTPRITVG